MSFYEEARKTVAYALKMGWARYPRGLSNKLIVDLPTIVDPRTQPAATRKCVKCGWTWADQGKSCPCCFGEQFVLV